MGEEITVLPMFFVLSMLLPPHLGTRNICLAANRNVERPHYRNGRSRHCPEEAPRLCCGSCVVSTAVVSCCELSTAVVSCC